ncbi:hypothetical protein F5884DRAFT_685119 [Xylogone sp. PMI_703]|nr:hypothetical protein F5884DRAFT_685119 [Xylogone sp. PMI_703]
MQPNACSIQKVKDDMAGPVPRRDRSSPEPPQILWSALQVGTLSGMSGVLVGSFAGVLRSKTPVLFALASGVQWFALGSTFTGVSSASRGLFLHSRGAERASARDKTYASTLAGGVAGSAGGFLRGRGNIIPGAIMFALFGALGQTTYIVIGARNLAQPVEEAPTTRSSWLNSKWSPVKVLSDAEYEEMLQEKLLKINAEIALVDESITALQKERASSEQNSREAS